MSKVTKRARPLAELLKRRCRYIGHWAIDIRDDPDSKKDEEEKEYGGEEAKDEDEEEDDLSSHWLANSTEADAVEELEEWEEEWNFINENKLRRVDPDQPERHMTKARGKWYIKRYAQKKTWYKMQAEAKILAESPRTEGSLLSEEKHNIKSVVSKRFALVGVQ